MKRDLLHIGEVAEKTGLNPKTIRYYEEIGLIPPPKRSQAGHASNGYRIFTEADIERLEFIKRAKLLDLSLEQIKDVLSVVENGYRTTARPYLQSLLEAKIGEVSKKIEHLQILRKDLERIYRNLTEVAEEAQAECCDPFCGPSTCGGQGVVVTITSSARRAHVKGNQRKAEEKV